MDIHTDAMRMALAALKETAIAEQMWVYRGGIGTVETKWVYEHPGAISALEKALAATCETCRDNQDCDTRDLWWCVGSDESGRYCCYWQPTTDPVQAEREK